METILELDAHEIKQIKKALKEKDGAGEPLHSTFIKNANLLFEACF
jgi:hypothetical protein